MELIFDLMNTDKSADIFRRIRWKGGIVCPRCGSRDKRNVSTRHDGIKRYHCNGCNRSFTDITGTVIERSHIPIWKWLFAAYLLRFNVSDRQISFELGVEENTASRIARLIRSSAFFRDSEAYACVSGGSR